MALDQNLWYQTEDRNFWQDTGKMPNLLKYQERELEENSLLKKLDIPQLAGVCGFGLVVYGALSSNNIITKWGLSLVMGSKFLGFGRETEKT